MDLKDYKHQLDSVYDRSSMAKITDFQNSNFFGYYSNRLTNEEEEELIQKKLTNVEKSDFFQSYEEGSIEEFTIKLDYCPDEEEESLLISLQDDDF